MSSRRAIACVLMLVMVVVPVVGMAVDDLSVSPHGSHREAGLRHQPPRSGRSAPAAVESPRPVLPAVSFVPLDATEPPLVLPLLVRTPFVPPRA
jgi:hypothetical protein